MICKKSHGIVFSLMVLLLALLVSCPSPYETPTDTGGSNGGGDNNGGNGNNGGGDNNGNDGNGDGDGNNGGGETGGIEKPSFNAEDILFATGKSIVIVNTTENLTVDGNLTEAFWNSAVPMDNFTIQASVTAPSSNTIGKMAYGTDGLYVAFTGTFAENTGPVSYEGLSVHISFDTGLGQNATGYTAIIPLTQNANEEISIAHNAAPNVSALSSSKYEKEAIVSNITFSAEMKIPYSSIGVSNVNLVKNIKINLMRFRPFTEGISSWVPTKGVYYQQDLPVVAADGSITEKTAYDLHTFNIKDCFMGDVYLSTSTEYLKPTKTEIFVKESGSLGVSITHDAITSGNNFTIEMFDVFGIKMPTTTSNNLKNGNTYAFYVEHGTLKEVGLYKLRITQDNTKIYDIVFDREIIIENASNMQLENIRKPTQTLEVEYTSASSTIQEIIAYIPRQVGFMFVGDPEAGANARPYDLFDFDENEPYKITSKANASVSYPQSSGTYANNGKDTYTVNGQTVEYPYYKDTQGKKYYFDAMLDTFQRDLAIKKTIALSKTDDYLGTARLLHAFSVAYETYAPVHDREWLNYLVESVEGDANPYWGGMWYRWWQADLGANYLGSLVESFNNIAGTNAFEVLSDEVDIDVREKVLTMFEDSMEYIDEYPNLNHNMDFNIWNGKILLAEAFYNPDFVHQTLERIEKFIQEGFLFDGGWKEISISYHNQSVEGIDEASALLDGYSDPDGYESPRTGTHIDDIDIGELFPTIGAAMSFNGKLVYPDNSYVPIGDTWADENYNGSNAFYDSLLLPASQIARITKVKESNSDKNQVYLMAAPKYGHNQYDSLNMVLYANGEELLPDIGYTHSYLRAWTQSTLAHNTVVVDRQDMNVDGVAEDSGSITLFKDGSTVSLMSASNPKAYDGVSVYERNVFTVTIPNGSIYVLDLFNVEGGSRHEYSLNGPFLSGTTATSSKTMSDYNNTLLDSGTTFEYPTSESEEGTNSANDYYAYMYITDVDSVDTDDSDVAITFDTTNANNNTQMKVTNLTKGNNELFLGKAFSLQTLRTNGIDDQLSTLQSDKAPKMVLRCEGNSLESKFVTLIEPDSIKANSVVYTENSNGGTIIMHFTGFTDTIYYSNSNTITVDGTTHNARFAFKREYTRTRQATHFEIIGENKSGDVLKSFRKANGDPINGFEIANMSESDLTGMENITITHPNGTRNTYQITGMGDAGTSVYIDIGTMDTGFTYVENVYKQNFFPLNDWSNQGEKPTAIFN